MVTGASTDKHLLAVRVFDERTKKVAYTKQTQAVKGKNESNCPLCGVGGRGGDNANMARIYDFDEMDADHVAAWSKGGDTSAKKLRRPSDGGRTPERVANPRRASAIREVRVPPALLDFQK